MAEGDKIRRQLDDQLEPPLLISSVSTDLFNWLCIHLYVDLHTTPREFLASQAVLTDRKDLPELKEEETRPVPKSVALRQFREWFKQNHLQPEVLAIFVESQKLWAQEQQMGVLFRLQNLFLKMVLLNGTRRSASALQTLVRDVATIQLQTEKHPIVAKLSKALDQFIDTPSPPIDRDKCLQLVERLQTAELDDPQARAYATLCDVGPRAVLEHKLKENKTKEQEHPRAWIEGDVLSMSKQLSVTINRSKQEQELLSRYLPGMPEIAQIPEAWFHEYGASNLERDANQFIYHSVPLINETGHLWKVLSYGLGEVLTRKSEQVPCMFWSAQKMDELRAYLVFLGIQRDLPSVFGSTQQSQSGFTRTYHLFLQMSAFLAEWTLQPQTQLLAPRFSLSPSEFAGNDRVLYLCGFDVTLRDAEFIHLETNHVSPTSLVYPLRIMQQWLRASFVLMQQTLTSPSDEWVRIKRVICNTYDAWLRADFHQLAKQNETLVRALRAEILRPKEPTTPRKPLAEQKQDKQPMVIDPLSKKRPPPPDDYPITPPSDKRRRAGADKENVNPGDTTFVLPPVRPKVSRRLSFADEDKSVAKRQKQLEAPFIPSWITSAGLSELGKTRTLAQVRARFNKLVEFGQHETCIIWRVTEMRQSWSACLQLTDTLHEFARTFVEAFHEWDYRDNPDESDVLQLFIHRLSASRRAYAVSELNQVGFIASEEKDGLVAVRVQLGLPLVHNLMSELVVDVLRILPKWNPLLDRLDDASATMVHKKRSENLRPTAAGQEAEAFGVSVQRLFKKLDPPADFLSHCKEYTKKIKKWEDLYDAGKDANGGIVPPFSQAVAFEVFNVNDALRWYEHMVAEEKKRPRAGVPPRADNFFAEKFELKDDVYKSMEVFAKRLRDVSDQIAGETKDTVHNHSNHVRYVPKDPLIDVAGTQSAVAAESWIALEKVLLEEEKGSTGGGSSSFSFRKESLKFVQDPTEGGYVRKLDTGPNEMRFQLIYAFLEDHHEILKKAGILKNIQGNGDMAPYPMFTEAAVDATVKQLTTDITALEGAQVNRNTQIDTLTANHRAEGDKLKEVKADFERGNASQQDVDNQRARVKQKFTELDKEKKAYEADEKKLNELRERKTLAEEDLAKKKNANNLLEYALAFFMMPLKLGALFTKRYGTDATPHCFDRTMIGAAFYVSMQSNRRKNIKLFVYNELDHRTYRLDTESGGKVTTYPEDILVMPTPQLMVAMTRSVTREQTLNDMIQEAIDSNPAIKENTAADRKQKAEIEELAKAYFKGSNPEDSILKSQLIKTIKDFVRIHKATHAQRTEDGLEVVDPDGFSVLGWVIRNWKAWFEMRSPLKGADGTGIEDPMARVGALLSALAISKSGFGGSKSARMSASANESERSMISSLFLADLAQFEAYTSTPSSFDSGDSAWKRSAFEQVREMLGVNILNQEVFDILSAIYDKRVVYVDRKDEIQFTDVPLHDTETNRALIKQNRVHRRVFKVDPKQRGPLRALTAIVKFYGWCHGQTDYGSDGHIKHWMNFVAAMIPFRLDTVNYPIPYIQAGMTKIRSSIYREIAIKCRPKLTPILEGDDEMDEKHMNVDEDKEEKKESCDACFQSAKRQIELLVNDFILNVHRDRKEQVYVFPKRQWTRWQSKEPLDDPNDITDVRKLQHAHDQSTTETHTNEGKTLGRALGRAGRILRLLREISELPAVREAQDNKDVISWTFRLALVNAVMSPLVEKKNSDWEAFVNYFLKAPEFPSRNGLMMSTLEKVMDRKIQDADRDALLGKKFLPINYGSNKSQIDMALAIDLSLQYKVEERNDESIFVEYALSLHIVHRAPIALLTCLRTTIALTAPTVANSCFAIKLNEHKYLQLASRLLAPTDATMEMSWVWKEIHNVITSGGKPHPPAGFMSSIINEFSMQSPDPRSFTLNKATDELVTWMQETVTRAQMFDEAFGIASRTPITQENWLRTMLRSSGTKEEAKTAQRLSSHWPKRLLTLLSIANRIFTRAFVKDIEVKGDREATNKEIEAYMLENLGNLDQGVRQLLAEIDDAVATTTQNLILRLKGKKDDRGMFEEHIAIMLHTFHIRNAAQLFSQFMTSVRGYIVISNGDATGALIRRVQSVKDKMAKDKKAAAADDIQEDEKAAPADNMQEDDDDVIEPQVQIQRRPSRIAERKNVPTAPVEPLTPLEAMLFLTYDADQANSINLGKKLETLRRVIERVNPEAAHVIDPTRPETFQRQVFFRGRSIHSLTQSMMGEREPQEEQKLGVPETETKARLASMHSMLLDRDIEEALTLDLSSAWRPTFKFATTNETAKKVTTIIGLLAPVKRHFEVDTVNKSIARGSFAEASIRRTQEIDRLNKSIRMLQAKKMGRANQDEKTADELKGSYETTLNDAQTAELQQLTEGRLNYLAIEHKANEVLATCEMRHKTNITAKFHNFQRVYTESLTFMSQEFAAPLRRLIQLGDTTPTAQLQRLRYTLLILITINEILDATVELLGLLGEQRDDSMTDEALKLLHVADEAMRVGATPEQQEQYANEWIEECTKTCRQVTGARGEAARVALEKMLKRTEQHLGALHNKAKMRERINTKRLAQGGSLENALIDFNFRLIEAMYDVRKAKREVDQLCEVVTKWAATSSAIATHVTIISVTAAAKLGLNWLGGLLGHAMARNYHIQDSWLQFTSVLAQTRQQIGLEDRRHVLADFARRIPVVRVDTAETTWVPVLQNVLHTMKSTDQTQWLSIWNKLRTETSEAKFKLTPEKWASLGSKEQETLQKCWTSVRDMMARALSDDPDLAEGMQTPLLKDLVNGSQSSTLNGVFTEICLDWTYEHFGYDAKHNGVRISDSAGRLLELVSANGVNGGIVNEYIQADMYARGTTTYKTAEEITQGIKSLMALGYSAYQLENFFSVTLRDLAGNSYPRVARMLQELRFGSMPVQVATFTGVVAWNMYKAQVTPQYARMGFALLFMGSARLATAVMVLLSQNGMSRQFLHSLRSAPRRAFTWEEPDPALPLKSFVDMLLLVHGIAQVLPKQSHLTELAAAAYMSESGGVSPDMISWLLTDSFRYGELGKLQTGFKANVAGYFTSFADFAINTYNRGAILSSGGIPPEIENARNVLGAPVLLVPDSTQRFAVPTKVAYPVAYAASELALSDTTTANDIVAKLSQQIQSASIKKAIVIVNEVIVKPQDAQTPATLTAGVRDAFLKVWTKQYDKEPPPQLTFVTVDQMQRETYRHRDVPAILDRYAKLPASHSETTQMMKANLADPNFVSKFQSAVDAASPSSPSKMLQCMQKEVLAKGEEPVLLCNTPEGRLWYFNFQIINEAGCALFYEFINSKLVEHFVEKSKGSIINAHDIANAAVRFITMCAPYILVGLAEASAKSVGLPESVEAWLAGLKYAGFGSTWLRLRTADTTSHFAQVLSNWWSKQPDMTSDDGSLVAFTEPERAILRALHPQNYIKMKLEERALIRNLRASATLDLARYFFQLQYWIPTSISTLSGYLAMLLQAGTSAVALGKLLRQRWYGANEQEKKVVTFAVLGLTAIPLLSGAWTLYGLWTGASVLPSMYASTLGLVSKDILLKIISEHKAQKFVVPENKETWPTRVRLSRGTREILAYLTKDDAERKLLLPEDDAERKLLMTGPKAVTTKDEDPMDTKEEKGQEAPQHRTLQLNRGADWDGKEQFYIEKEEHEFEQRLLQGFDTRRFVVPHYLNDERFIRFSLIELEE